MFDWDVIVEPCRKAAGADPALADDDSVLDGIGRINEARRFLDAAEAHLLAEADARGVCDRDHGLSTRRWLAREAGLPQPVASARVRVARRLRSTFGVLDEALTEGRVGWEQVRVVERATNVRNEAAMVALQDTVLDDAAGSVFEGWAARVNQLARLADQDGSGPGDDLSGSRARLSKTLDGAVKVDAVLAGTLGELVHQAVHARADHLYRQAVRDHQHCPDIAIPARDVLLALALVQLTTGHTPPLPDTTDHPANDTDDTDDVADHDIDDAGGDDNGGKETGGDAVSATAADGATATASPGPAGTCRPGGPDEGLVLPPGWGPAPRRGRVEATFVVLGSAPGQLLTPDGIALDDQWARALACDAHLHPIVIDTLGVPLDAGRTIRHANSAQRRAIARRDGGCTLPGCPHPFAWCDVHHIQPWDHQGPTDLDNLVALCRHHHGVTHRTGWTMTPQPHGWFTWTTPNGHTLWSQRHHRQHPGPDLDGPAQEQAGSDPP